MRLRLIVFIKFWMCRWPLDTKRVLIIYSHLQNYFFLLYIFYFTTISQFSNVPDNYRRVPEIHNYRILSEYINNIPPLT